MTRVAANVLSQAAVLRPPLSAIAARCILPGTQQQKCTGKLTHAARRRSQNLLHIRQQLFHQRIDIVLVGERFLFAIDQQTVVEAFE